MSDLKKDNQYDELLDGLYKEFRIDEYNEKVRALNTFFDKYRDDHIVNKSSNLLVNGPVSLDWSLLDSAVKAIRIPKRSLAQLNAAPGYGNLTINTKKAVGDISKKTFVISDVMEKIKEYDPNASQPSVSNVLKRWAADESDTEGIKIIELGRGNQPNIYGWKKG